MSNDKFRPTTEGIICFVSLARDTISYFTDITRLVKVTRGRISCEHCVSTIYHFNRSALVYFRMFHFITHTCFTPRAYRTRKSACAGRCMWGGSSQFGGTARLQIRRYFGLEAEQADTRFAFDRTEERSKHGKTHVVNESGRFHRNHE